MSPKKDDALATTTAPSALEIPDWMKNDAEAQALNARFDADEVRVPQLKICQSLTPQRKRSDPNFIPNLAEGDFFNDTSGRIYELPIRFVTLKFWVNYLVMKDFKDGGGIVSRGLVGTDGVVRDEAGKVLRTGFGPAGEKPEVTKFMNYLFYLPETREIVWFSAKSTALKPMKGFNSSLRAVQGVPDFAKVFELRTGVPPGAAAEYFVPVIPRLPSAIVTDPEVYANLKKLALDLKDKAIDTSAAETPDEDVEVEAVPF